MAILMLRGIPIGNYEGVLFDKDGTLSHSEPHLLKLAEARIDAALDLWSTTGQSHNPELHLLLSRAFGLENGGLHPAGTLAVAARQDNMISMATVFCLLGCNWPRALELSKRCFEQVDQRHDNSHSPSPLLPHADRLLQRLHDAGIQLAVISNDTRSGIQSFLKHHGLSDRFSGCWSADDQPRKPNPEAVHQLCQRLNLTPERCALIGDAETDLSMARMAGIGCVIGYLGGWAKQPDLPSATHRLMDWDDLVTITTP